MSTAETKSLIEQSVRNFQKEVPALTQLKLVIELELRGRGDIQLFRVEVPGPKVTRDIASAMCRPMRSCRTITGRMSAAAACSMMWLTG